MFWRLWRNDRIWHMTCSLEQRHAYLVHHILPIMTRSDSVFGELCLRLRGADNLYRLVGEFELPFAEPTTPRQWFDWGMQSIHRDDKSVPLYCLCNYWSFPSENNQVDSQDVIAFRMLRILQAKIQKYDVPIRVDPRAEDIRRVSEDAAIRWELREQLAKGSGLTCLADGWKNHILGVLTTRPTAWILEYKSRNLEIIRRHIEEYSRQPIGDGEQEFSQLCRRLRSGNGIDGLSAGVATGRPHTYASDPNSWLKSAHIALSMGKAPEAVYCAAAFLAAPVLRKELDGDIELAMKIILESVPRLRHRNAAAERGSSPSIYRGMSWTNPNYACHEVVCPVCRKGSEYGSGKYAVELRAYFSYSDGPDNSLDRRLTELRIKCGGACTVGTGDSSGLYLVQAGACVNWSRQKTLTYLTNMRSPLACKFENGGEFDQTASEHS